ncbi:MAG: protein tyrosine phosphatase [Frankia sp.]|nr:protein tyrosine phosphatase [Frankia sp.]
MRETDDNEAERFDLLFVCTGNICRSPMAELMTIHRLQQLLGHDARRFVVHSAGTHGLTGVPLEYSASQALADMGIRADGFRARELTARQVEGADLVLGATRQHRAAAVTLVPRAAARTFTIREFARLVRDVDVAELPGDDVVTRARALVRAAAARRGLTRARPEDDDVVDPYGGPSGGFQACAATIADALQTPIEIICATAAAAGRTAGD